MARPRVVHVYKDVYPPVEGGIERSIYHMARLTRDRFEPLIITAARGPKSAERTICGTIEVREAATYGRFMSAPVAPGFVSELRRSGADLFHFHLPHPTGEIAYLLSGLKTPAVATYHSDIVRQQTALRLYGPFLHRFLGKIRVIMPTTARYQQTSEILARHAERCRPVALGLPPEDYDPDEATRALTAQYRERWGNFVFFIGVLRYYKGLNYLIEAMAALEGVHLVIAGEGPSGPELREQTEKAALGDRIHFLGRVDHRSAVALFRAASVFCLPAHLRAEAFGLCQIEAMICGLPVVSTDLPTGVPEVNRHEESGLIVPARDPEALADALGRILKDESLRKALGEGGRRRALEFFTARRMADNVAEIYREVLEGD